MESFELIGRIGDHAVRASWAEGSLSVSPLLMFAADRLIAAGVQFPHNDRMVEAGLEDFTAAALTLVRCCEVTAFSMSGTNERAATEGAVLRLVVGV